VQPATIEPPQLAIRPYRPADRDAVYAICLGTGDAGGDASALYRDPELIGHVYAGPYLALEPDLCFVLADRDRLVGYVLGTRDSPRFEAACERDWFSPLRVRYPMPDAAETGRDARMKRLIHAGYRADPALAAWPAHLQAVAVGGSSEAALARHGIGRVIAPRERFDSEALLALPALAADRLAGRRAVIFRGERAESAAEAFAGFLQGGEVAR
jgi:hypothetical protein